MLRWLKIPHYPFTWIASFVGAYVGSFSHIGLDAIMHADMRPWWPLGTGNGLLGLISIEQLHTACLVAGLLGTAVIAVRFKLRGRA